MRHTRTAQWRERRVELQCGSSSVEAPVWKLQCGSSSVEAPVWKLQCGSRSRRWVRGESHGDGAAGVGWSAAIATIHARRSHGCFQVFVTHAADILARHAEATGQSTFHSLTRRGERLVAAAQGRVSVESAQVHTHVSARRRREVCPHELFGRPEQRGRGPKEELRKHDAHKQVAHRCLTQHAVKHLVGGQI